MDDNYYVTKEGFYTRNWFFEREIMLSKRIKLIFSQMFKIPFHNIKKIIWKKTFFLIRLDDNSKTLIFHKDNLIKNIFKKFSYSINYEDVYLFSDSKQYLHKMNNFLKQYVSYPTSQIFNKIYFDEKAIIQCDNQIYKNEFCPDKAYGCYYFRWGLKEAEILFTNKDSWSTRIDKDYSISHNYAIHSINYGDVECLSVSLRQNNKNHLFFMDVPRISINKETNDSVSEFENIPLYQKESIYGGKDLLAKNVYNATKKLPSAIKIHYTCTPLILGENLNSNKICEDCAFIYSDNLNGEKDIYLDKYLKIINNQEYLTKHNRINLIGFPPNQKNHLIKYLCSFGLSVNSSVLPNISEDHLKSLFDGKLNVFFSKSVYNYYYSSLFNHIKIKSIFPKNPFGFKRTKDWFEEIFLNIFVDIKKKDTFIKKVNLLSKEYDFYKNIAMKKRLGLIFSGDDMESIIHEEKNYSSIPLIEYLKDMGFNLTIMFYTPKNHFTKIKNNLNALLTQNDYIFLIKNKNELNYYLKNEYDAFYSDFNFDMILQKNGLNRFSIANAGFEMGFEGALNTLKKILEITNYKFNRKFNRYFDKSMSNYDEKLSGVLNIV